jgi:hypothetical protein
MKIAYLHGLESVIDEKDPKIIFLRQQFSDAYAPDINYKEKDFFKKLLSNVSSMNPDLIVGSSAGGYISYLIGSKLSIPTLLFNPAMVGRSYEPVVDTTNLKNTKHTIYFGNRDTVINGNNVKSFFKEEGVGSFEYNTYSGGHRVPADVFINSIKEVLNLKEIYNKNKTNKMKHIKLYEDFINEAKLDFMISQPIIMNDLKYTILKVKDDVIEVIDARKNPKSFSLKSVVSQNPGIDVKPKAAKKETVLNPDWVKAYTKAEYNRILKGVVADNGGTENAYDLAQNLIIDPRMRTKLFNDYPMLRTMDKYIERLQWDIESRI